MAAQAGIAAEPLIRLAAFLAVFAAVALWEALAPRRSRAFARRARWPHNIALVFLDNALVRVVAPGAAIAVALATVGVMTSERQQVTRSLAAVEAIRAVPATMTRELNPPFAERVLAPTLARFARLGRRLPLRIGPFRCRDEPTGVL